MATVAAFLLPPGAWAANHRLLAIAGQSVVAVHSPGGLTTGFAFGKAVIVGADRNGATIITDTGIVTRVAAFRHDGQLTAVSGAPRSLRPLTRASRDARSGTVAYILGSPLGYRPGKITRVVLRFAGSPSAHTRVVRGHVAGGDLGAPVVTGTGRVIGAVEAVDPHTWSLLPRSGVRVLSISRASAGPSGGLSTIFLVTIALIVFLVAAGGTLRFARRHRKRTTHALRSANAPTTTGIPVVDEERPVVRFREPPAATPDEDFEIVLKSHEVNDEPA